MNILERSKNLIELSGNNRLSTSSYDSSFLMLEEFEPVALNVRKNILESSRESGSWGGQIEYPYDRIICTLGMITNGEKYLSKKRIECAKKYLEKQINSLDNSFYETIGFELLFPYLAEKAGIKVNPTSPYLKKFTHQREMKFDKLKEAIYSPSSLLVHSLESFGNNIDTEKIKQRQEIDGSMAGSPSATSHFYKISGDKSAYSFIARTARLFKRGLPTIYPIEIFEINWLLENFSLSPSLEKVARKYAGRKISYLRNSWSNKNGLSHSRNFSVTCGDDSFLALKNIHRFTNLKPKLNIIDHFATNKGFRSFPFEYNASVSTNAHLLSCLLELPKNAKTIKAYDNAINAIKRHEQDSFWFDKWHISPYYPTSKIYISEARRGNHLHRTLDWILKTQRLEGGWGYYNIGTCEETAFAVQSLYFAMKKGINIPKESLKKARYFLNKEYKGYTYPEMWIGKTLYAPISVIDSYILSALDMLDALENDYNRKKFLQKSEQILNEGIKGLPKSVSKRIESVSKTVEVVAYKELTAKKRNFLTEFILWLFAIDDYLDSTKTPLAKKLFLIEELKLLKSDHRLIVFGRQVFKELERYPLFEEYQSNLYKKYREYLNSLEWEIRNIKKEPSPEKYLEQSKISIGFKLYSAILLIIYNYSYNKEDLVRIEKMVDWASLATRLANDIRSQRREEKEDSLNYLTMSTINRKAIEEMLVKANITCKEIASTIKTKYGLLERTMPRLCDYTIRFYSKYDFTDN
ncbi:hypothetical protein ACFL0Z_03310 [Patescibacteria group bacterium]